MAAKRCAYVHCDEPVPDARKKFHASACGNKERVRRHRERVKDHEFGGKIAKVVSKAEALDGRGSMRRGDDYDRFVKAGGPGLAKAQFGRKKLTHEEIAELFGVSRVTVTHWLAAYAEDSVLEVEKEQWEAPDEAVASLDDFTTFRQRYFRKGGKPYAVPEFHLRWVQSLLDAVESGGRQMILSPPRHGKTDLLIHFACWLICRNPDIHVVWVGKNERVAKRSVGQVLRELENNERLIEDFCGPGGSFKPGGRTATTWTRDEFTVATRTEESKSPTMVAVGKGGTLLSMDADLIVADDIEDHKSTVQPNQREQTRDWWATDLGSREEEHTAWIVIGSRQHPEDLYSFLLADPEWECIVEQAHRDECDIPWNDEDSHSGCMLWPERNTFKWLMSKRRSALARPGGVGAWEMVYLNRPRAEGMTVFSRDAVEGCFDRSSVLGQIPPDTRLIAGLDPAPKGFQAVILWAVHVESNTRTLVDLQNEKAGGTPHLRAVLAEWSVRYPNLKKWVIEENIAKDTIVNDRDIQEIKRLHNLQFLPHVTSKTNKHHDVMGVTAQSTLFAQSLLPVEQRSGGIVLPYGNDETRAKVQQYVTQLVNYSSSANAHQTTYKTDLVMAGWFPEKEIQSWTREFTSGMSVEYGGAVGALGGLGSLDGLFGGSN